MQAMLKGEQKTKLSKIGQLVAAYNVGGASTTDSRLCQWLFPCRGDHNKIEASSEIEGRIVPSLLLQTCTDIKKKFRALH